jgi:hypothetical protein
VEILAILFNSDLLASIMTKYKVFGKR